MKILVNPNEGSLQEALRRPTVDQQQLIGTVSDILRAVRQNGDAALMQLARTYDRVVPQSLMADEAEISAQAQLVPRNLQQAITTAAGNIGLYHATQVRGYSERVSTMPGVVCWSKQVAIDKVGLYIPGGSAPLFSTLLMLAVPAKLAGCKEIVVCTPPGEAGLLHPAIAFTAQYLGISRVYKTGGAQAIAAMAYGTATIPKVDKIFGPGNQYVTAAKQLVQLEGLAIDMPAGPSEVCVLCDELANPAYIAADLLSQAEHGADSQVVLVTTSLALVNQVQEQLQLQLAQLSRASIAQKALQHSIALITENLSKAMQIVNAYAPEHLIIATADAATIAEQVRNAGSVFIGAFSPESVGDYASGTNHTLPTNGFARAYSGVSVDSFSKRISFQELSADGLASIAPTVITMAQAEGLDAHANAVKIRLNGKD